MKVSVSSYSLSRYMAEEKKDLFDAIERAAEIGFAGMEFTGFPDDVAGTDKTSRIAFAEKIRASVEQHGMATVAYTVGADLWKTGDELSRAIQKLKDEVDVAAALGVPVMRHDLTWGLAKNGAGRSFLGMMPALAESVREITAYAASRGIRTCSENHGFVAQDSYRMEAFLTLVNHDNYGLLVDMGNFMCADEDPITAVSRIANFAFHVHAKDFIKVKPGVPGSFMTRGCNALMAIAVGDGDVPVKQCLQILKRAGYDGWVSLEFEGRDDCLTSVKKGYENLTKYISELL